MLIGRVSMLSGKQGELKSYLYLIISNGRQQFTLIAGKRAAMDGKNLNYSMRILKIIKEHLDLA